jgi:hypothetical protein
MQASKSYCWRRLDFEGLEILQLTRNAHGVEAHAYIIEAETRSALRAD